MCRRVSLRSSLQIVIVLLIGVALFPAPCISLAGKRDGPESGPGTTHRTTTASRQA